MLERPSGEDSILFGASHATLQQFRSVSFIPLTASISIVYRCSGKKDPAHDATDVIKTWHKIENQLDKEKHKHMKAFLDEVEKCFLPDDDQGHAVPEHHGAE